MTNASLATAKSRTKSPSKSAAPFAVDHIQRKRSRIHGAGVFARRPIAKGTRIVEYTGEHISQAEADRRYEDRADDDSHTFLFEVGKNLVIDGGVGGSLARFINHSCDGNCEITIEHRRIYIDSIRAIREGEELTYDYWLVCDLDDPSELEVYACHCGSPNCRGSMLAPKPEPPPRRSRPRPENAAGRARR
ncbi:MAG: SET domain-containing protein-lysine N-methyltransferase [Polyangiaceae bacterium]|nr:SET domain-containing protein-lysine N-methyltransferase [Polyangiaceae bacterium]